MELTIKDKNPIVELEVEEVFESDGSGTPAQINDYQKLKNKPSINEVELTGDRSFEDLGLSPLSNLEIMQIINKAMRKGL